MMSKRTFIFCDACNPQGIRTDHKGVLYSRRACDVRSWHEGDEKEVVDAGWETTSEGLDICPKCQRNGLGEQVIYKKDHSIRQFVNLVRKVQVI